MHIIQSIKYTKYCIGVIWNNWHKTRQTYSQHGEDIFIENLLGHNSVRSFIDVGANDGVLFSNTYKFAKNGAQGLCFEPSKTTYLKLRLNHLFHNNVKCFRQAASNVDGNAPFIEDGYEAILSRLGSESSINKNGVRVQTVTLASVLRKYPSFQEIDLLSVDVEGHEKEVLEGLDGGSFKSRIIILESDKTNIESVLSVPILQDYIPRYTNGVNLILTHKNLSHSSKKFTQEELGGFQCF